MILDAQNTLMKSKHLPEKRKDRVPLSSSFPARISKVFPVKIGGFLIEIRLIEYSPAFADLSAESFDSFNYFFIEAFL